MYLFDQVRMKKNIRYQRNVYLVLTHQVVILQMTTSWQIIVYL